MSLGVGHASAVSTARVGGRFSLGLILSSAPKRGPRFEQRFGRERDLDGLGPVLVRSGALEARLATTKGEVRRAQRLRYRVFFQRGGAVPDPMPRLTRRDICRFDGVSDHLIVVDGTLLSPDDGEPECVGVYRLLRQDVAEHNFGFCSSSEFDVDSLVARHPRTRFLEVGRACIVESHRSGRVLQLLWRGLWAYARHHKMDTLIGCASLPGLEIADHADAIRMLAATGDPSWRAGPRPECAGALAPRGAASAVDARSLFHALPPLVKGYWRLGATFSAVPAIDRVFGTTDLFVAMPLHDIERRYLQHFGCRR